MPKSFTCAVALALLAAQAPADSITNAKARSAAPTAGDTCSLLSLSEVEQALGGKPEKPTPISAQPNSPGGCAYVVLARGASITLMVFETADAAEFYTTLVRGAADANHFKEEAVPGLGTQAAHMPSNFFVRMGGKILMFTYGGAPRAKVEGLVRKLVAQLS